MHLYRYENVNFKKTKYDGIRDFCLCEKIDEEYMRSLIKRDCCGVRGIMKKEGVENIVKIESKRAGKKILSYGIAILLLLIFQKALGKAGRSIADVLSYEKFDPDKAFAWVSIHHIVEMLAALVIVILLSKLLKIDFGFGTGDRKTAIKYTLLYTAVFIGITLVCHIFMLISGSLPVYDYPLSIRNIMGTLGFQLFLSGPVEEILYRALPITMLVYVLGKSVKVKWGITLETIIASLLFAIAHMKLSLFPFNIETNYFQLIYAFAQGIILGKAYQDSRSVVYPIFMHSISNVLMVGTGYLFLLL